jgi:hypothetical protein
MQSTTNQTKAADEPWSVFHPMAPQDRIVVDQMRAVTGPNKGKLRGIAARAHRGDLVTRRTTRTK